MNFLMEIVGDEAVVAPTRSHHILLVEDDEPTRQFTTLILIRSGYEVDAAEDGQAGWEALHAKNYDLLITDNCMPKLSGVELVKKVRSARMTLPVIMASGALPTEELDRNPHLQLAATVQKPFGRDEFLNTVKKVLTVGVNNSYLIENA